VNVSRLLFRVLSLSLGTSAVALGAAPATTPVPAPTPAPTAASREISLKGPEVIKLDWNTRALQAVDMNGDGLNDLVVADNDRSAIQILYQIKPGAPTTLPRSVNTNRWEPVVEDARFRKASITTGVTVFDLVVGDFNGDGKPDLAYTGDPQALTLRLQQPDGTWLEKKITEAPVPLQFVGALRTADLNGDGRADLVVLGQKELAVFYQDDKGQMKVPERYALPDENCYGLEICDVNGDGLPDLVYLCSNSRDGLRIRLQTAEHQFGPEQAYPIKPTRSTLQILKQANKKQGAVFAFAQDVTGQIEEFRLDATPATPGAPSLRPRVFSPRPGSKTPAAYALGDFNGDGLLDVAVSDPDGAQVFIYLRQAHGGFTSAQHFPIFSDTRSIAAGDWDGNNRAELFVVSSKEQTVGVSSFTNDGRLSYPQPLPSTGKPLAVTAGNLTGDGHLYLAVLREEKGKRFIDLWTKKAAAPELVKSIEMTGLKTDPRAVRFVDANQDGKLDIVVFTPLDSMRLFVQGDALNFTEISTNANFRKGLVDNLEASAVSLGDIDGDGKPELIVSGGGFARALRVNEKGELTVVDQFNARDPGAEVTTALVLPTAAAKTPSIILYDKKTEQFQTLRSNEHALYQVVDTTPAGKIEVVSSETRLSADGKTSEAFIFGKDRFWWMPLGRGDFTPTTLQTHATDLPDINYSDVIAGDLNNDGQPELVCVDPEKNLIEILSRGADNRWESMVHFKVFETDEHFQGRKGPPQEPRETIIADVTGDGKNDLILLVHDRILVYPQY